MMQDEHMDTNNFFTATQVLRIALAAGYVEYFGESMECYEDDQAAELTRRFSAAVKAGFLDINNDYGNISLTEKGEQYVAAATAATAA